MAMAMAVYLCYAYLNTYSKRFKEKTIITATNELLSRSQILHLMFCTIIFLSAI